MSDSDGSDFDAPVRKRTQTKAPARSKARAMPSDSASDTAASDFDASGSDSFSPPKATKKPAPKKKTAAAPRAKKAASEKRPDSVDLDADDSVPSTETNSVGRKTPSDGRKTPADGQPRSKPKTIEEIYQKKTQLEHILLRPDTYIGSTEPVTSMLWVYENDRMVHRNITYVPGLYKIFDEIIVNAADNKIRDPTMDTIRVNIDRENARISVYNTGRGIPIEIHAKEGVYVPELIFGHLLTSSNYDDDERKVTGGRNGYGAKLCNIFSTEFIVETADSRSGKLFKQVFTKNMSCKSDPVIKDSKKNEDYTRITFKPDLAKFSLDSITEDIEALLRKRVYDLAGCVHNIKVYLNDTRIKIKDFKDYVEMYLDQPMPETNVKPPIVYERVNDRWEIAFTVSEGQFTQVSFANNICTTKGGVHVNMVVDQIVAAVIDAVKKKDKKGVPLKPHQVKNHVWIFVNCLIENPTFDSQTKENMTLRASAFGSKCPVSEAFIKKVLKTGVVDNVLSFAKFNQDQMLKKSDGRGKRVRIGGIPKLDDANNAGRKSSDQCTLILTEGDSAKSLAVSGLSVVGRDNFGVFPLRGKLLNVREASPTQITNNAEITAIKQILGLQHGKVYESTSELRYGHLMIMTDQDYDGSHIKGLIINFIDKFWPSLLRVPGFLLEFITPIVRVSRGKGNQRREISFFTVPEYERWKEANDDGRAWTIKYFKGLGTSTAADAKQYFSDMGKHLKPFKPADEEAHALIDMAFSKKKADDRKEWLRRFQPGTYMDHSLPEIPIPDFVNKELILFSMADNARSIPSSVDGFKPGQRKILFACFKRNLRSEIKVAQLAGYVAEHSAYHHGEQSLNATIVGMAQQFVGSNNLALLDPLGQFGCLDPKTPVLMWDGCIKCAKDVRVGDALVGDDGRPRRVLQTTSGIDTMYKVSMSNGESYVVNSQHILTLFDGRSRASSENATNVSGSLMDIKIEDMLMLPESDRTQLYCVKNTKPVEWNRKSTSIDPYVFGCWLGDHGDGTGLIAAKDIEVCQAFVEYIGSVRCESTQDENANQNMNVGEPDGSKDKMDAMMATWNDMLSRNRLGGRHGKHVPMEYIVNDQAVRLHVLAGLIDMAGSAIVDMNGVTCYKVWWPSEISKHMIESVRTIAHSLGLQTNVTCNNEDGQPIIVTILTIYGEKVNEIPARALRNQLSDESDFATTSHLVSFNVTKLGSGEFCGWQTDGNERFLLGDFTITHNSRLQGGKDAASPRYIFTNLTPLARTVFHPADDALLKYLNDDGQNIEPEWYLPVLPMLLVNGSDGIGTGWSSSIPNYNPRDIVECLNVLMDADLAAIRAGEDPGAAVSAVQLPELHPWYRGFTGTIERESADRYRVTGTIEKTSPTTVEISELPIRTWTQSYKEQLETWMNGVASSGKEKDADKQGDKLQKEQKPWISDYREYHTDARVHFTVTVASESIMEEAEREGLEKRFKLTTTISVSNLVCFDLHGRIKKYESVHDIVRDFYLLRRQYYQKRKDHMLAMLTFEYDRLDNKVRFVTEIIRGELVVQNRKKTDILADLRARKYKMITKKQAAKVAAGGFGAASTDAVEEDDEDENEGGSGIVAGDHGYDYLLSMPIWSLTWEKVQQLERDMRDREQEIKNLLSRTILDLWREDLDSFLEMWDKYESDLAVAEAQRPNNRSTATGGRRGRKVGAGKKASAKPGARGKSKNDDDEDGMMDDDGESDADFMPKKKGAAKSAAAKSVVDTAIEALTAKRLSLTSTDGLDAIPAARKRVSPPRIAAAAGATKRAASKSSAKIYEIDSDDDDQDADVAMGAATKRAQTSEPASLEPSPKRRFLGGKKTTVPKSSEIARMGGSSSAAPTKPSGQLTIDLTKKSTISLDDSDDSDDDAQVGPSKIVPTAAAKSVKKPPAKKAAATKPKSTTTVKRGKSKQTVSDDDDEEEASFVDDDDEEAPAARGSRRAAARRVATYRVANDDDEEDDDEDDDDATVGHEDDSFDD